MKNKCLLCVNYIDKYKCKSCVDYNYFDEKAKAEDRRITNEFAKKYS